MAQLDKHLSDTRRRLQRPTRAALDDGDLAEYIIESIDSLVTDLNSSGEPWYLQTTLIDVIPGEAQYPLTNVPNFGRGRYLYTVDIANSNRENRHPIPIVGYDSFHELYGGGDRSASIGVVPSSTPRWANAATIYYLREAPGPGNIIEFASVPSQQAQYKLIYEPDVVRPGAKQDLGFRLAQFDGYVAALSALRALPHCQWKGITPAQAATRKVEIANTCNYDIGSTNERRGYAWQFWCFQQSSTQTSSPSVVGWAEDRR